MSTSRSFEIDVEERLIRLTGRGVQLGMERISRLLLLLENPQQSLAVIHVGGTNGKGTTSQLIAEVLTASGYRVGRFTSPHLHSYRERFVIDGTMIPAERLAAYLDQMQNLTADWPEEDLPTEFEILTAIMFLYFYEEAVDYVVLEVGMGGIYDSTNCIIPLVAVVTSVDLDHVAFLGSDLASIAWNKAGIIKSQVPVVIGKLHKEARTVIEAAAVKAEAALLSGEAVTIQGVKPCFPGQIVNITGGGWQFSQINFNLSGSYQRDNLAVALMTLGELRKQGILIPDQAILTVLSRINIPGRMEILAQKPLVLCDVAHNPHGVAALASSLAEWFPEQRYVLLLSIVDDKDKSAMIAPLGKMARLAVVTRPDGHRNLRWRETTEIFHGLYPQTEVVEAEDIATAVDLALSELQSDEYLLITGSFYLMDQARSEVLRKFGSR